MRLYDIGERRAIKMILKILSKSENYVTSIGDDCAALDLGDEYLLVTSDMITERTHIPPGMNPSQIGWFIVAINLSDIAAKGGKPLGVLLALGLPRGTSDVFLKNLIRGADRCASCFNTSIIGGDTKENSRLTLCGSAVGLVKKGEYMPRCGARVGDMVAVTGVLGRAAAGYIAIKHRLKNKGLTKGLYEPNPRLREGTVLSGLRVVSSCMDISDGLSSSLYQLRDINNVGFDIYLENIPVASELDHIRRNLRVNVVDYALHFGGDYELLVTLPEDSYRIAEERLRSIGCSFRAIGKVTDSGRVMIYKEGKGSILEDKGYEHFKRKNYRLKG
ncbi:MAG: thiamine-phosphate kinase [Candidatus Thermoplasmatota archaeon]